MQTTTRRRWAAVATLVLGLAGAATAQGQAPGELSGQRQREIKATLAKRRGLKARQHARASAERAALDAADRARAAAGAAYLRANTSTYAAVTRDGRGRVKDTYVRMPDGSTSFRTADGYVSDTQVIAAP